MGKRDSKRLKKNGKKTREKRTTESSHVFDKNCETISYRIYGNPNGEGFLIEARMFKASDGKNEKKKREKQTLYSVYVNEEIKMVPATL